MSSYWPLPIIRDLSFLWNLSWNFPSDKQDLVKQLQSLNSHSWFRENLCEFWDVKLCSNQIDNCCDRVSSQQYHVKSWKLSSKCEVPGINLTLFWSMEPWNTRLLFHNHHERQDSSLTRRIVSIFSVSISESPPATFWKYQWRLTGISGHSFNIWQ